MLTARSLRCRALRLWPRHTILRARCFSSAQDPPSKTRETLVDGGKGRKEGQIRPDNVHLTHIKQRKGRRQDSNSTGESKDTTQERSLYEQLFPEQDTERTRQETEDPQPPQVQPAARRNVRVNDPFAKKKRDKAWEQTFVSRVIRHKEAQEGEETSVLVLRNVSKNLIEEDFRRLIPQSQQLEGWRLEQGDIVKIVPGRDLATLEQKNWYYLIFSSRLSAYTYQGHVTRVHKLVAAHTPTSMLSPMPLPPGYTVQGMDGPAAIESFALVPSNQSLDLRQLKPPLSPMMASIVRNDGYAAIVNRKDHMPFAARLTLDGPQLTSKRIHFVFMKSAEERALAWSGKAEELAPRLMLWEPLNHTQAPSAMSHKERAETWGRWQARQDSARSESEPAANTMHGHGDEVTNDEDSATTERLRHRTPQLVHIAGFYTERAMQSFVHFWHRRPMEWKGSKDKGFEEEEGDLAPIANVEVLW